MGYEFTTDEIKNIARAARVHCPGFTQDMFEGLMELERRIDDSGYLEAVQGLIHLEEERGIPCSQALDAYQELLEQKADLEKQLSGLEQKADALGTKNKKAREESERIKVNIADEKRELVGVTNERAAAERKLGNLNRKAEREKRRIAREIKGCRRQANVTEEEVAIAGQIKAEVERHGFTLEIILGLSKEFTGHKNARDELAQGLNEHGSLTKYLRELDERGNKEKTRIESEITDLESQKNKLESYRRQLEDYLSQLRTDIYDEKELRRFYNRYHGVSHLMDHLEGWTQMYFLRCNNPTFAFTGAFNHNLGNAQFWTDKPPAMCPHCGYRHLLYDEKIYQAFNCPAGTPLKITLGENNG